MAWVYIGEMAFSTIAALLSTIVAIYCTLPYIRSILQRKTKPHQLSWLVFAIMNAVVLLSQYFAGARGSVLISLVFFAGSLVILALSLKYGVRDTSRWDRVLFAFALGTIAVWAVTKSNGMAIWLTVLVDIAATAMIALKARAAPRSEDPYPWFLTTLAYFLSCLTLAGKPLGIVYVRPLYGLAINGALVAAIYYWRAKAPGQQAADILEI